MIKPKISVITVVFNNVNDIERTVKSVISQTYSEVEYIVIDGASTDGTLDVLKKHSDSIQVLLSEKDSGIYDAMNKGLERATGDYVVFMNSGDEFYNENTLKTIFEDNFQVKGEQTPDIFYGDTLLIDENLNVLGKREHALPKEFNWKSFQRGMTVCHQAIYIKRSLCSPYDLQYKLSSDIDWVIRAAKKSNWNIRVNEIVAKYLVGGLSDKKHKESLKERFEILSKHYGYFTNIINHIYIIFRFGFRKITGKKRI